MPYFTNAQQLMPPRNPKIAVLLAVFFGPFAQIYCGRLRRALAIELAKWVCGVAAIAISLYLPFGLIGVVVCWLVLILIKTGIVVDAFRLAKRPPKTTLRPYQTWWAYIVLLAGTVAYDQLALAFFKANWVETYQTRVVSMADTILMGDSYFVDKLSTRLRQPRRLDIIAYYREGPSHSIDCKRIIGLPGDTIEIRDEVVYLNNERLNESYVKYVGDKTGDDELENFGPTTVPDDKMFVLGDNRRQSKDSRMDGFASLDSIVGYVGVISWSCEIKPDFEGSIGLSSLQYVSGAVRWNRIGRRVQMR